MVIFGIDPGTVTTGYGLIESSPGGFKVREFGCIHTDAQQPFALRLKHIYDQICKIILHQHPDELALEDVFYAANAKMVLRIGQARGVALLAAANHQLPICEYSPREVKQAVVGNGAASKEQVQRMVASLLHLEEVPTPFDVADALAVAICHGQRVGKSDRMLAAESKPR